MASSSRKHYSDVFVYDSRVRTEFTSSENEGCVTVCLLSEDSYKAKKEGRAAYVIAFERWKTDAEGYMTRNKFNEALAYALGLSEARRALEDMNKTWTSDHVRDSK